MKSSFLHYEGFLFLLKVPLHSGITLLPVDITLGVVDKDMIANADANRSGREWSIQQFSIVNRANSHLVIFTSNLSPTLCRQVW